MYLILLLRERTTITIVTIAQHFATIYICCKEYDIARNGKRETHGMRGSEWKL